MVWVRCGWAVLIAIVATAATSSLQLLFAGPVPREPFVRSLLVLGCGSFGLAVFLASFALLMRSDPRIWRRDSAFMRRLGREAGHEPTDEDEHELRVTFRHVLAGMGGVAFAVCALMGLGDVDFGSFIVLGMLLAGIGTWGLGLALK
jgi:hypothetical protein